MMIEFARCVTEASPEWWLLENVSRAPNVTSLDSHSCRQLGHIYITQRIDINQGWYCDVTRLRHIQFGSKSGRLLNVTRRTVTGQKEGAALANDDRDFRILCRLQGLPGDFDIPPFKVEAKKKAVGNGVPLVIGRDLANEIKRIYAGAVTDNRVCRCGCGRQVTGKARYNNPACRKRAQRKRDRAGITGE